MTLEGRHIVVTGGGTGVGADTARTLAAAGAVREAFAAARAANVPVSGVIANAGAAVSVPFAKMSADQLQSMLSVNLIGVSNVWQEALADMKAGGWGRMIAIALTAGLKG